MLLKEISLSPYKNLLEIVYDFDKFFKDNI